MDTNEDDVIKFNNDDLLDVSYEEQSEYFKALQSIFTDINLKRMTMSKDQYLAEYISTLEAVAGLAVTGNVPAMDYLCFLYKRGIDDIIDRNLARAHQWGMLAIAAGSKLSIERLRLFLEPVFQYVIDYGDIEAIIKKNELADDEIAEFVAYSFANIFVQDMGITLEQQAKKQLNESESFQIFNKQAESVRNTVLPKMLDLIS